MSSLPPPPPPLHLLESRYLPNPLSAIQAVTGEVITHVDGESYFAAIAAAMDKAKANTDAVYIVNWAFDRVTRLRPADPPIETVLQTKAGAGVDVRMLLWVNQRLLDSDHAPWFGNASYWNAWINDLLPGITKADVVRNNIDQAMQLRSHASLKGRIMLDWSGARGHHAKYVVVKVGPEVRAFIGGMDLLRSRWDRVGHPTIGRVGWHDVGVELVGDGAVTAYQDFAVRWEEVTLLSPAEFTYAGSSPQPFNPAPLLPPPPALTPSGAAKPGATISTQVSRSYPPYREELLWGKSFTDVEWKNHPEEGVREILQGLVNAMRTAKKFIYVEDQALNMSFPVLMTHDMLFPHLVAAANRGVKVIFLTSGKPDPADPQVWPNDVLGDEIKEEIVEKISPANRGNFVMYRVEGTTVHSKVVIVDDEFYSIGSANFWDQSMTGEDTEINLLAVATDNHVKDFRVGLWAEHLRLTFPLDPVFKAEMEDPTKALAIWDTAWVDPAVLPLKTPNPGPVLKRTGP